MKDKIKYYPVGNGDQSLIILKDGTRIAVDCNIRKESVGSNDPKLFDVRKDILASIERRNGIPFVDIFILTHGDQDHCRGFKDYYYQGDPEKYGDKNLEAEEIMIDEMWFSPMIAAEHKNDNEEAYQQEAERRIEFHLKNDPLKNLPGNRIRIIGYDGNKDYSGLEHLHYTPGTVVTSFNEKKQDCFSIFIHAPFKEHLATADNRNTTSIVFQARFKENAYDTRFSNLAMFGGDADYIAWQVIYERTMRYNNEGALYWDLFLAPHHCSWTYFNEHEKDEPEESSLEILRYGRSGGIVISSSKKILRNSDNPPSYRAKMQYIKQLDDEDNFLNTDVEPDEDGPQPIVFVMTENGPAQEPHSKVSNAAGAAGGSGAASTIITQG